MKEILDEVERWREAGEKVVVATVVATRRSAPRPVGTSLAISESGKMCGSVSGGCVESDVYENAMDVMQSGEAKMLSYGITDEMAWGVGLALRRRDRRLRRGCRVSLLRRLSELRDSGERGVLFTVVEGDGIGGKELLLETGERIGGGVPDEATTPVRRARPPRTQQAALARRRREGVCRVVRPAAADLRLRRGRYGGGALPGGEAPRLDGDRR